MPFLFLAIGLVLAILFLVYFQKGATLSSQRVFWRFMLFVIVPASLFYLLILGRFWPAALVVLIILPLVVKEIKSLKKLPEGLDGEVTPPTVKLDAKEAFEVLGLEDGANAEDIQKAHAKLIKKNHPDQDGSAWIAARLNAARDLLLDELSKEH